MASAPRVATFVLVLASIFAISLGTPQGEGARKSYIVHVVKSAKPSHFTSHHKWYASMLRQVSQSVPHATELLYTYDTVLHGFAAMLSSAEAEDMENLEGMKNNKITETNSSTLSIANSSKRWQEKLFLPTTLNGCLAIIPSSGILWNYSTYGEGIIVDVIDTGIWPESKSFSDAGLGPIPARWKGICEVGQKFNSSNCNKEIIGARNYFKGYEKNYNTGIDPVSEYKSPRDSGEHGTHVASIVAGAPVDVSSWFGNVKVRGMAPQARLTIYKACWKDGCTDADITAAIDQAIANGVDIISISISSKDVPFYKSTRAIVVFGAIKNGTLVSASGGNSGPFHLIRVTYCHGLRL
ncbi:subtilisin-like protease SBT1.4 [Cryptomeria japonica]|uniref:subtilisin-like protease SBT1.4 n=1 Tax=Cryptomeria japonica TaxID=3369 RepID=UPI0025ABFA89|nr:subtilisin-like protease SBT1.4 [Cryptomeria japonica]